MTSAAAACDDLRAAGILVRTDLRARAAAGSDHGRIRTTRPVAVAVPRSASEAARALEIAVAHELPVAPRGLGRSAGGQGVAPDGALALDLHRLDRMTVVDDGEALWCEAGATWRAVVDAAAGIGRVPVLAPNFLDLTVGGTVSVGGYGAASFRHGAIAATVGELDVATPAAGRARCGPAHDRERWDAVRGGFGRHGLVLAARVPLTRAAPRVTSVVVLHDDPADAEAAARALGARGDVALLEGFAAAMPTGFRFGDGRSGAISTWRYGTRVGLEHAPGAAPAVADVLDGVPPGVVAHCEEGAPADFLRRLDPYYAELAATGADAGAKPRVDFLLPWSAVTTVLPEVLAGMPPEMGVLHPLSPVALDRLPPLAAAPPGHAGVELVAMPDRGVGGPALDRCLSWVEDAHEALTAVGGVRYPVGWLGDRPAAALDRLTGTRAARWAAARERHDPRGVLTALAWAA